MAKSRSILKLAGTIGDLTFVRSRAYGDHVRAKRGTYKKIKLNAAMKKQTKVIQQVNVPAKIFKDAINPYRGVLKDGSLWSRLISKLHEPVSKREDIDFNKLDRFEMHRTHQFQHLLQVHPTITVDKENSSLEVAVTYISHPNLTKVKDTDGYRLSFIGIYPDLKKKTASTVMKQSHVIGMKDAVAPLVIRLDVPKNAKQFIVCIKIEGCINGGASDTLTTSGLCVIGIGAI